jgi:acyl transferase domain-containing protein
MPKNYRQIEDWLLERVAEASGRDLAGIRADERFTQYGLDSLALTGIIARAAAAVGKPVEPTAAWRYPTPAELAGHLAGIASASGTSNADTAGARLSAREPIAVISMAARLPGAITTAQFWDRLVSGQDSIVPTPTDRWDLARWFHPDRDERGRVATREGGFLDGIAEFDPLFFGISPAEAAAMDPQQRLMLELAWEALDDAGARPGTLRGRSVGVFTGAMWTDYAALLASDPDLMSSYSATGADTSLISARISYVLGLTGPSITVNTACSSSLVAIHQAVRAIRNGDCAWALAGGVSLMLTPASTVAMSRFGAMSPTGRCKAFDSRADGYVRGEGAGLVVLAPLSSALAQAGRVYCTVLGGAINNDGFSNGLTAPNPVAQEAVIRLACADAGVDPGEVDFVETHGTGTALGDPIEAGALGAVYGVERDHALVLGAVKTNLGHLEAAAGVAGFIKTALSLYHRMIPPNLHFRQPNPNIDLDGWRLTVPTAPLPWPARAPGRARAGVSGFGFGGTNCHVVLGDRARTDVTPRLRGVRTRPVVLVFAGQGSQWPAMAADLMDHPGFADAVLRCDLAFAPHLGGSIAEALCRPDPLPSTQWIQAGIFTMQVGLTARWLADGLRPAAVIGQSMGEIAAAYACGALSLDDAVLIVASRTRLIAELARPGAMAVVELDSALVRGRIADGGHEQVAVAVAAAPGRCVVSGGPQQVAAFIAELTADGGTVRQVDVDYASHGVAMDPVLPALRAELAGLAPGPGTVPMWSTVTASPVAGTELTAGYWCRNLREPVAFADTVAAVAEHLGDPVFLDVNPHPISVRDVRACVPTLTVPASLRRGESASAVHAETVAALCDTAANHCAADPGVAAAAANLLVVSARDPGALPDAARQLARRVRDADAREFVDICHTALRRRDHHEHRLAVVAAAGSPAATALDLAADRAAAAGLSPRRRGPRIVFVFPGQGGQHIGMGVRLYAEEPAFRRAAHACAELVAAEAGPDLLPWLTGEYPLDVESFDVVQPALFTVAIGLAALLREWGVEPDAVIGHSMGEVAAAAVCGALSLPDAVRVICRRSAALAELSGAGTMVLADLDEERAGHIIAEFDGVEIAAVNGPRTRVFTGPAETMTSLAARLRAQQVLMRELKVNGAAHSRQVEPGLPALRTALRGLLPRVARIPFLSTVTATAHRGADLDADYWARNLRQQVRFAEVVAREMETGPVCFVELSPHPVLTGAVEEVAALGPSGSAVTAVTVLHRDRPDREGLLTAIAALYVAGVDPDPIRLPVPPGRPISLPPPQWRRRRYWVTEAPPDEAPQAARDLRAELEAADPDRAAALVRRFLTGQLCALLGTRAEELLTDAPITTSGATSLIAMRLRNAVVRDLGVTIPVSVLLGAENIAVLADLVLRGDAEATVAREAVDYEEVSL